MWPYLWYIYIYLYTYPLIWHMYISFNKDLWCMIRYTDTFFNIDLWYMIWYTDISSNIEIGYVIWYIQISPSIEHINILQYRPLIYDMIYIYILKHGPLIQDMIYRYILQYTDWIYDMIHLNWSRKLSTCQRFVRTKVESCIRIWIHVTADFRFGPRNMTGKFFRCYQMKSAVTYVQILMYYSTLIQTNVSQLQCFRDQNLLQYRPLIYDMIYMYIL